MKDYKQIFSLSIFAENHFPHAYLTSEKGLYAITPLDLWLRRVSRRQCVCFNLLPWAPE